MPHEDLLAITPYALLSVLTMATAVIFGLSVALRLRRWVMLPGAVAMAMLSVWFGVLAMTSGPAPLLRRGDAADYLRWLALATAMVWLAWLVLYALSLVRVERRQRSRDV
jgi:hypothetical protein